MRLYLIFAMRYKQYPNDQSVLIDHRDKGTRKLKYSSLSAQMHQEQMSISQVFYVFKLTETILGTVNASDFAHAQHDAFPNQIPVGTSDASVGRICIHSCVNHQHRFPSSPGSHQFGDQPDRTCVPGQRGQLHTR